MATLNNIIYDVLEKLNAYSDDTDFSEEHIAFLVNTKRSMLLQQLMSNTRRELPQEAIQTVCMSLEIDDDCFDEFKVLKSINKVPATISNTGRSNLIKAYPVSTRMFKKINIIDYSRLPFLQAEKYLHNQLFVTIDPDSYLIVFNIQEKHLMLEELKIEGIFEDPELANDLSCDSTDEDFWDMQYPIDGSLIDPLKNSIVQELLMKYQLPQDQINDGEDPGQMQNVRWLNSNRGDRR